MRLILKGSILLLLASGALSALGQPFFVHACSNRSAVGRYGYSCSGFAPNPTANNAIQPFAAYGVVVADGRGHWNGQGKVSFNGTILPWTHDTHPDDPAAVDPDCSGNVTYEVTVAGAPIPDVHFDFVIVNQGREVKGFPMEPGWAVTCQLVQE